jgi:hypothetical protein
MNRREPFLLLRARPMPEDINEFRAWFRKVHIPDARKVPGFSQIEVAETKAGTFMAFYTFANVESVQQALASPQAAYARGTLEQWAPRLEELLIEMFSPLGPLPIFSSRN